MGRRVRFIPSEGSLVEVTVRTIQSRFLLRPSSSLNEVIGGVLGRAQRLHEVRCHAAVFLSNHYHLLLSVDHAHQLARFMEYVGSNLAREVKRLVDWPEHVWGRRYQAILVSEEESTQVDRLRYLLSHGVKEGLVAHARDWPGVHSVREILADEPIRGLWFDRTQEYAARNRGDETGRLTYATEEALTLTPLPCWAHLPPETYRQRVAALVEEIETSAAIELAQSGREPLGATEISRQQPHTRPNSTAKSPAPFYHAATKAVRQAFWEAYALFLAAFRDAGDRWREGDRKARFPVGSFPPGPPFVTTEAVGPP